MPLSAIPPATAQVCGVTWGMYSKIYACPFFSSVVSCVFCLIFRFFVGFLCVCSHFSSCQNPLSDVRVFVFSPRRCRCIQPTAKFNCRERQHGQTVRAFLVYISCAHLRWSEHTLSRIVWILALSV